MAAAPGPVNVPYVAASTTSSPSATTVIPYRTELNPLSFLRRTALLYPNKPAALYNSLSISYGSLASRSRRLATGLQTALKGCPGNSTLGGRCVVAVLLFNTPAMLDAFFGLPLVGAVMVAINTRLNADEVQYILQKSKANILIVDRELLPLIPTVPVSANATSPTGIVPVKADSIPSLSSVLVVDDHPEQPEKDRYERFLVTAGKAELPFDAFPKLKAEDDIIAVNFTSGTTGRPKGVMYHYRGAYLNALSELIEIGMNSDSKYLWTLPMFHASGWCFPWAVTAAGAAHVLLRKIDYAEIWRLFNAHGITHFCAAPTVQTFIVNHPSAKRLPHQVKTMVAAAPPSPTLLEAMMALNILPVHVYGLTETYGPSAVCAWQTEWKSLPVHEQAQFLSRQGHGFPTADEVRVIDPATGKDVPMDGNTMGEVVFSGNLVMAGYLDDPEATAKAFQGGVFHTGDLGVRHADGYVELRDRMKDIIISGGENISTIEVENAVTAHPLVLEACVVSTPDATWGERPVAYLTLKTRVAPNTPAMEAVKSDLTKHLRAQLAGFKMPARLEIVDELPKTSTGKVQKYVVRDMEWKRAGKDVKGKKIN
ncbi:AMP-dependent synthetase and ligase [Zopfochytrium polystomum]|nr:AMP-dependent synthetase and ligase [Zopfochytrium polystomum]